MKAYNKYASLQGNLVMVGFGSVGQAVLPLLFRHFEIHPKQIRIISADANGEEIAREFGVASTYHVLTEKNYLSVLEPCLNKGDFLLNLSVDVSSLALIELCWRLEVLISGYLHRAMARRLHRHVNICVTAVQLCSA